MAKLVKISVPIPENSIYGGDSETMWGQPLGDGLFELRNVPFFAQGMSMRDVVRAQAQNEILVFEKVEYHRGHSTYRFYARDGRHGPLIRSIISELNKLGATVEPADDKLVAVDVPSEADVYAVYAVLRGAKDAGVLDFQEGHCGHPLRE